MENTFSYWMRENLKDAFSGLITQDIDFVFINVNKKYFYFLEEKNSKYARVGPAQKILFKMFDDLFKTNINEYIFLGTHIIVLEEKIKPEDLKKIINEKIKKRTYYDMRPLQGS